MQESNHVVDRDALPVLKSVQPQLAVNDVAATVAHWQEVLGFPGKWFWGDPPVHAGVNWGETQVQFALNPVLAEKAEGQQIAIDVDHIDALYAMHQRSGAHIVSPLESEPWGMAGYTVRDNNGYRIRFGAPSSDREKSSAPLPDTIRILSRIPTPDEYKRLRKSVGWHGADDDALVLKALAAVVHAAVAVDSATGEVVGSALLLGDGAHFYYVKDVNVHPDWQGKRVGTALMRELMDWADANGPDGAMIGLYTGEMLTNFYGQFGFRAGYGMTRTVRRRGIKS